HLLVLPAALLFGAEEDEVKDPHQREQREHLEEGRRAPVRPLPEEIAHLTPTPRRRPPPAPGSFPPPARRASRASGADRSAGCAAWRAGRRASRAPAPAAGARPGSSVHTSSTGRRPPPDPRPE